MICKRWGNPEEVIKTGEIDFDKQGNETCSFDLKVKSLNYLPFGVSKNVGKLKREWQLDENSWRK